MNTATLSRWMAPAALILTGKVDSFAGTFPGTVGPDLTFGGASDAYVAKVNVTGTGLDYCGYIGGTSNEYGFAIDVDGSGNALRCRPRASYQTSGFPVIRRTRPDV